MKRDDVTVNGVKVQDAPGAEPHDVRTLVLPSGKSAAIRKGFGRDLMRAQRVAGPSSDPTAVIFALIAELVEIDGSKMVYEDLLAMELGDVLSLQAEVAGANFQVPPPADSQPSFTSASE
jgi:hypothetical protein